MIASRTTTSACPPRDACHGACSADNPACPTRRLASGLQGFLSDGLPPPPAALTLAAARGFSAGNGLLTGQRVDRST